MEETQKGGPRSSKQLFRPVFPEVCSVESESSESNNARGGVDLYRSAKPLVIMGRLLLTIPCGPTNSQTYKKPTLRWNTLPLLLGILLSCWSLVELCMSIKALLNANSSEDRGILGYLQSSFFLIYSASTSFTRIYFLLRSDRFYKLLGKWSVVCREYKLTQNKSFGNVAWLLLGLIVPSLVAQGWFIASGMINRRNPNNMTPLEDYYGVEMQGWNNTIPFHPGFAAFHCIFSNLSYFPLYLVSSVIVFFSRAASSQFTTLIETTSSASQVDSVHNVNLANRDKRGWEDLVSKYNGIVYLVKTGNQFLSPLLFSNMTYYVYMVCLQMFEALFGSDTMPFSKQLFGFSLLVDVTWLFVTLLSVAQVQSDGIRILDVLKHCPMEFYERSGVARLENRVCSGPHIGFTGLGFFIITKRFMVKVVGAIFAIEIVWLQAAESARSNQSKYYANQTIIY